MARMKWEYTVRSANTTVEFLNKLGDEGWELIAAGDGILFFKRPNVKGTEDGLNWGGLWDLWHKGAPKGNAT